MGNACCSKDGNGARGWNGNFSISSRGRSRSRKETIAVNMKNFKNLRFIDNINSFYQFGDPLGQGSYGAVYKARRIGADWDVAMKVIKKDSLESNPMLPQLMMSELTILKKCSHPHIMSVLEILEDEDHFYIVSEWLEGGELFDRLVDVKAFSEQKAAYISKQVLLALNYMHKKNITHRDLKPENILLESKEKD